MLRRPSQTLSGSAIAEVCDQYSWIAFVTNGTTAFFEMIDLTSHASLTAKALNRASDT